MYEFDLIHSEDLGNKLYSNIEIHCCLNIYKRNQNGLNKKPNYKLKDVTIKESIKNNNPKRNKFITKSEFNYDIRVMGWGGGYGRKYNIGDEVEYEGQFAKEFCIKVNNDKYRDKILNIFKNTNWRDIYPMTSTPNLLQWQIYKYLKEQIPELE